MRGRRWGKAPLGARATRKNRINQLIKIKRKRKKKKRDLLQNKICPTIRPSVPTYLVKVQGAFYPLAKLEVAIIVGVGVPALGLIIKEHVVWDRRVLGGDELCGEIVEGLDV